MYWSTGAGGHCSIGTTSPATTWYFAEGSTKDYDTWLCMQNPQPTPAVVNLTYMDNSGNTLTESINIDPYQRYTRKINDVTAMNNKEGVATKIEVTTGSGIVAERAMYWSTGSAGHCSIGTTSPATTWYFAEGSTK